MNVSDDVKFNILKMLEMKNLGTKEKGDFIREIIKEEGISMREFARRHGLPHSTVQDWLSGRQMKKYYDSKNSSKEINMLLDRIVFVLSKQEYVLDDKGKRLLLLLKAELEKVNL